MEPKFEQPKQHTPEEIAKLEKSRIFHDADLLEGGADYIADSSGSVRLEITPKQYTEKHNEAKASIREAIALEQWRKEEPERRERDRLAKIREAEEEKLDNLRKNISQQQRVGEFIKANPELAEKIEVIPTKIEMRPGQEYLLFRQKNIPSLAFLIYPKTKNRGITQYLLRVITPEQRLPEGVKETLFMTADVYELKRAVEKQSNDQKQAEKEIRDRLQEACTQNNIKYLVIKAGKTKYWEECFPGNPLEGVELVDAREYDAVKRKKNEARAMNPSIKDKKPIFDGDISATRPPWENE